MKKLFLTIALFLYSLFAISQNIGMNQDGTTPDTDALLHIKNTALTGAEPITLLRIQNTLNGANDRTGLQLYNNNTANSRWTIFVPGSSSTMLYIKNVQTTPTIRFEATSWGAGATFKTEYGAVDHYIKCAFNGGMEIYTNDDLRFYTGSGSGTSAGKYRLQIEESAGGTYNTTIMNIKNEWNSNGDYSKLRFGDDNHTILGEYGRGMIFNDDNKFNFTTGNVGINQESPEWKLQVTSTAANSATAIQVTNSDKTRYLTVFSGSSTADDTPALIWGSRGSGTAQTDGNALRMGTWSGSSGTLWQEHYKFLGDGNSSQVTYFKNGYQMNGSVANTFTIDIRTNTTTDFIGTVIVNDRFVVASGDAAANPLTGAYFEIGSGYNPITNLNDPNWGFIDIHGDKNIGIGDNLIPFNVSERDLGNATNTWDNIHCKKGLFNQENGDNDFVIGSQTNDYLFFADASTHRVGIGTNAPGQQLHLKNTVSTYMEVEAENDDEVGVYLLSGANDWWIWNQGTGTGGALWLSNGTGGDVVRFARNGNVGLGITPTSKLHIKSSADGAGGGLKIERAGNTNTWELNYNNDDMNWYYNGAAVGWWNHTGGAYSPSDKRLKENIRTLHYGLSDLMKIAPREYSLISDSVKNNLIGFIAQDLYQIIPEAVSKGGDDIKKNPWGINYTSLIPVLVKAIQEQQILIEELQKQLKQLQNK